MRIFNKTIRLRRPMGVWRIWATVGLSPQRMTGWVLPLVLTAGLIVVLGALYLSTNHLAHWRGVTAWDPQQVFGGSLDRSIPVIPWTIMIYHSLWLFYFLPYLLYPRTEAGARSFLRLGQAQIVMMCLACTVFLILPAEVNMRDQVQAELERGTTPYWLQRMFLETHRIDAPYNAWPCLHVAQPLLVILAVLRWRPNRWLGASLGLAFTALAISTWTTKQHFVWDVLAGIVVALVVDRIWTAPRSTDPAIEAPASQSPGAGTLRPDATTP